MRCSVWNGAIDTPTSFANHLPDTKISRTDGAHNPLVPNEAQLTQTVLEVLQAITGRPADPDTPISQELTSLQLMQFLLGVGKRIKLGPSLDTLRAEDFISVRAFVSSVLGGATHCAWKHDTKPK